MSPPVKPKSCDTFVVLPPSSPSGVIFGKNSDRPQGEIQEVVYFPATTSSDTIKCTYIEVESSGATNAVILSRPSWLWGAEMGANDKGVAIGNQAVWTNDNDGDHDPSVKRLLGMDLVRLGLERGSNAAEAMEVITSLLEKYGQGGPCSKSDKGFFYHNSYIIADTKVAWILETSGKHWVAEKVTSGYRNISNALTITTKIDKKSNGIEDYAKSKGLWDGKGDFNFCEVFSGEPKCEEPRFISGEKLLSKLSTSKNFKLTDMFAILRDKESGICMPCESAFSTQGSQVSVLSSSKPSVHWFTATPDPSKSVFKPFVFTPKASISKYTKCPEDKKDAPHTLYSLHAAAHKKCDVQDLLRSMENECVNELESILPNLGDDLSELDELLKDAVETEVKFYR